MKPTLTLLTALLLAPLAALLGTDALKPTLKSNIILILVFADDLGAKDLSCFGSKDFKTRTMTACVAEGTRFETFYACPLCAAGIVVW